VKYVIYLITSPNFIVYNKVGIYYLLSSRFISLLLLYTIRNRSPNTFELFGLVIRNNYPNHGYSIMVITTPWSGYTQITIIYIVTMTQSSQC
jgi:hypothetical protein